MSTFRYHNVYIPSMCLSVVFAWPSRLQPVRGPFDRRKPIWTCQGPVNNRTTRELGSRAVLSGQKEAVTATPQHFHEIVTMVMVQAKSIKDDPRCRMSPKNIGTSKEKLRITRTWWVQFHENPGPSGTMIFLKERQHTCGYQESPSKETSEICESWLEHIGTTN